MSRRGRLIVISAPSGGGKTTIAREILKRHPELHFSVSATTRPKRDGEVEGKHYYYLTREEFRARVDRGEVIEWEEIFGNLYGTLKTEVDGRLSAGTSVLFDIDVNGALAIKKLYGGNAVLIFVSPPDLVTLRSRLSNRKTETQEALQRRLERVPHELEQGKKFDHTVVNDELAPATSEVDAIVTRALAS
jgi:guanylate kinase